MDIIIHSLGMPFDGDTIKTQSLGGSETAAYYQGLELAKLGHRVMVFTGIKQPMERDGVQYLPIGDVTEQAPLGEQFEWYATSTPHDVLIIQRHPLAFHKRYNSRINVWQLHDLALYRTAGAVHGMLHNITFVTVVSEWHKQQVCKVYGLNPARVHVVRNGVDPALYAAAPDDLRDIKTPWSDYVWDVRNKDGKFCMLYQSRPERGLEHLVRPGGIMDRLKGTRAHLFYCAYANTVPQMQGFYQQLDEWAKALPNVTNLGALTKPHLAALQKSVDLLCYPTEFQETSCVTAMEAMHAGLPMLTSDVGALKETCRAYPGATRSNGTAIEDLLDGKADEGEFVKAIEQAMTPAEPGQMRWYDGCKEEQLDAAKHFTWTAAVKELSTQLTLAALESMSPAATVREAIEHSDIDAADLLLADNDPAKDNAILTAARIEVREQFDFRHSIDKYRAHYDSHQADYYGQGDHIGEDVTRTTRFQGVLQVLGSYVSRNPGFKYRVLDYGCAHGSFLVPFAKFFPHCEFVGMDISHRAVASARKWIEQDKIANLSVYRGDYTDLPPEVTAEPFDFVIAGEVMEHIPDDVGAMNTLASLVKPGGQMCMTTPAGRWEWSGMGHNTSFLTSREHMHHYTRADILEICAQHGKVEPLYAPACPDHAGGALGWWVWGVPLRKGGQFVKKAVTYRIPRQTLSACMIVKDAETTLLKCIKSFLHAVDEIVVAIDPKTSDGTRDILKGIIKAYPYKPIIVIDGLSATEAGFDAARNKTVERASGDWIMWCDADEEVLNPWHMWQYLRPSMINAVGFPQEHYSSDPPRVLTTDYPCRLFRNNMGVKFVGVVHEHPEVTIGEGIPFSTMRGDVKFQHNGYVNEKVRRERFIRNYPLLLRDRKENPDRKLNRFLMLRDHAQGLSFELEQSGGAVFSGQPERAREAIAIWREMLEKDPVKMVIDALQYYSSCVALLREGFDAKFDYQCHKPEAPDLNVTLSVGGRFQSRQDLKALVVKVHEEATAKYEEPYL